MLIKSLRYNALETFNNSEFGSLRSVLIDNEPWFVGKDVAEALGYTNPQKAIRDHVDEDDKGMNEMFTPGGTQNFLIINESGLYSLILSSKLPKAKQYKHWVTSEVLPSPSPPSSFTLTQSQHLLVTMEKCMQKRSSYFTTLDSMRKEVNQLEENGVAMKWFRPMGHIIPAFYFFRMLKKCCGYKQNQVRECTNQLIHLIHVM